MLKLVITNLKKIENMCFPQSIRKGQLCESMGPGLLGPPTMPRLLGTESHSLRLDPRSAVFC